MTIVRAWERQREGCVTLAGEVPRLIWQRLGVLGHSGSGCTMVVNLTGAKLTVLNYSVNDWKLEKQGLSYIPNMDWSCLMMTE